MEKNGRIRGGKDSLYVALGTITGVILGFMIGISLPNLDKTTEQFRFYSNAKGNYGGQNKSSGNPKNSSSTKINVPENPRGAETLPPAIIQPETDFYLRRLWGKPNEDLKYKQKYLVAFTVGAKQKQSIDASVKKFSSNFTILLFHYDNRASEWDEFEWSKRAIHVSVRKQAKWWYAKRFLHPDIVASYEYIFLWDEDLGLQHFNAEEYIKLVRKHGLEISQPALETKGYLSWKMTQRQPGKDIHRYVKERDGWCSDPHLPPCAGFVEIMAPVFSRKAWRCAWYLIQNDLVHGWGLDLSLQSCVEPAHEKIGVVDSQWVVHKMLPTLGNEGSSNDGRQPWVAVRERCFNEWSIFKSRMKEAKIKYYKENGIIIEANSTLNKN
ncbi:Lysine ketoglutarate reductase trans-splicing related 1 [Zostera marina]|uniref:Lysine ketoglutarate reductase trans-splicing related 1 n=1 Tax=Zostera marina TaxID=29655 RepID=A0A0K9NPN2_ZOSMR|nr:Lysine ketoglutarate reductase trans-splicing related 1 [Zostera marina]